MLSLMYTVGRNAVGTGVEVGGKGGVYTGGRGRGMGLSTVASALTLRVLSFSHRCRSDCSK